MFRYFILNAVIFFFFQGKCTFYVSDDEVPESIQDQARSDRIRQDQSRSDKNRQDQTCEKTRRAIMRPRRSRKVKFFFEKSILSFSILSNFFDRKVKISLKIITKNSFTY